MPLSSCSVDRLAGHAAYPYKFVYPEPEFVHERFAANPVTNLKKGYSIRPQKLINM